jgi:hypothetical protein
MLDGQIASLAPQPDTGIYPALSDSGNGHSPGNHTWGFTGQFASRLCYFWSEIGIKQVYICPDLNYGTAIHADKWIPILPNTDAALQLAIIYVWTGCAHLLDNGWKEPRCVDACPTLALKFGEESELKDLISKAEVLHPELGAKPRVYYLNIPKKFIGGTIYDPVEKEVIIGATCTLSGSNGSEKLTATTDSFGDFWFEGLEEGTYSLKIEAKGFAVKTIESISTEKDVNLGDIPLSK